MVEGDWQLPQRTPHSFPVTVLLQPQCGLPLGVRSCRLVVLWGVGPFTFLFDCEEGVGMRRCTISSYSCVTFTVPASISARL